MKGALQTGTDQRAHDYYLYRCKVINLPSVNNVEGSCWYTVSIIPPRSNFLPHKAEEVISCLLEK